MPNPSRLFGLAARHLLLRYSDHGEGRNGGVLEEVGKRDEATDDGEDQNKFEGMRAMKLVGKCEYDRKHIFFLKIRKTT